MVSYLPVGILSARFGRKRMIQAGVLLLAACFGTAILYTSFHFTVYIVFALVGAAWSMINVNSYPMVVEISKSSEVGKFTGYYYTATFSAQIASPIVYGFVRMLSGTYMSLFYYSPIMFVLSLLCILVVKHGEALPDEVIKAAEEAND